MAIKGLPSFFLDDDDVFEENNEPEVMAEEENLIGLRFPTDRALTLQDCRNELERIQTLLKNMSSEDIISNSPKPLIQDILKKSCMYTYDEIKLLPDNERKKILDKIAHEISLYFSIMMPETLFEQLKIAGVTCEDDEEDENSTSNAEILRNMLKNTDKSTEYIDTFMNNLNVQQQEIISSLSFNEAFKSDIFIQTMKDLNKSFYGEDILGKNCPPIDDYRGNGKEDIYFSLSDLDEKTGNIGFHFVQYASDIDDYEILDYEDMCEKFGSAFKQWCIKFKVQINADAFYLLKENEGIIKKNKIDPISALLPMMNIRYFSDINEKTDDNIVSEKALKEINNIVEGFMNQPIIQQVLSHLEEALGNVDVLTDDLKNLFTSLGLSEMESDMLFDILENTGAIRQLGDDLGVSEDMKDILGNNIDSENNLPSSPSHITGHMKIENLYDPEMIATVPYTRKTIAELEELMFTTLPISENEEISKDVLDKINIHYPYKNIGIEFPFKEYVSKLSIGDIRSNFALIDCELTISGNKGLIYAILCYSEKTKWHMFFPTFGNAFYLDGSELIFLRDYYQYGLFSHANLMMYDENEYLTSLKNIGKLQTFNSKNKVNVLKQECQKIGELFFYDNESSANLKKKHNITKDHMPIYLKIRNKNNDCSDLGKLIVGLDLGKYKQIQNAEVRYSDGNIFIELDWLYLASIGINKEES